MDGVRRTIIGVLAGAHLATIAKNELTVLVESVMITIDFDATGRKLMSKPIFDQD